VRLKSLFWLPLVLCLGGAASAEVLINEVAFNEPSGSPDWVELTNAGPQPASIDGWRLSDEDAAAGKEIVIRLSTPVPPGGFVTVYVDAAGTDRTDFAAGAAVVYSGTATTVNLAATEDEVSLYSGVPSSATLVDFTAWVTDGRYDGAADQSRAVAAGVWPEGSAVAADAAKGVSIGRIGPGISGPFPGLRPVRRTPFPTRPHRLHRGNRRSGRRFVTWSSTRWRGAARPHRRPGNGWSFSTAAPAPSSWTVGG
jgi:hypothetical protein